MRETLYSPPDGEGPSVVRETNLKCTGCNHLTGEIYPFCTLLRTFVARPWLTTLPLCPIVSADPETWEKRLKGEGT